MRLLMKTLLILIAGIIALLFTFAYANPHKRIASNAILNKTLAFEKIEPDGRGGYTVRHYDDGLGH